MHNAYRGGTPDVWYSGPGGDLWVEYKWVAKLPKSGEVVPDLSSLQKDWIEKRRAEGRRVWVIVGYPGGGVLFVRGGNAGPQAIDYLVNALQEACL